MPGEDHLQWVCQVRGPTEVREPGGRCLVAAGGGVCGPSGSLHVYECRTGTMLSPADGSHETGLKRGDTSRLPACQLPDSRASRPFLARWILPLRREG